MRRVRAINRKPRIQPQLYLGSRMHMEPTLANCTTRVLVHNLRQCPSGSLGERQASTETDVTARYARVICVSASSAQSQRKR